MRTPLDSYDEMPQGMITYLRYNGWHFNKKLFELAKPDKITKEEVDSLLEKYGVKLDNNTGYDYCYVAAMAKSDFYGRSIPNDQYLALYIKDVIDDKDQYDGFIFNRFYADCCHKGLPIPWDDIL